MSPAPDRKALEELWKRRLDDAKLRLDFARNYVNEVRRENPSRDISETDYLVADRLSRHSEELALAEYNRVLRIYTDLIEHGIIPYQGA